jgi:hypothetical protein
MEDKRMVLPALISSRFSFTCLPTTTAARPPHFLTHCYARAHTPTLRSAFGSVRTLWQLDWGRTS